MKVGGDERTAEEVDVDNQMDAQRVWEHTNQCERLVRAQGGALELWRWRVLCNGNSVYPRSSTGPMEKSEPNSLTMAVDVHVDARIVVNVHRKVIYVDDILMRKTASEKHSSST
jgi:hypothetical protein